MLPGVILATYENTHDTEHAAAVISRYGAVFAVHGVGGSPRGGVSGASARELADLPERDRRFDQRSRRELGMLDRRAPALAVYRQAACDASQARAPSASLRRGGWSPGSHQLVLRR